MLSLREKNGGLIGILSCFFIIYGCATGVALTAKPPLLQRVRAGECNVCHESKGKVPQGHVATKGLNLQQCLDCHIKDSPRFVNTLPLSHSHLLSGVSCQDCHDNPESPEAVGSDICISCHEIGGLVEKTKDNKEANPHDSHYGPELDCDLCHHVHIASENFCNQCHEYTFVIPSPIGGVRRLYYQGNAGRLGHLFHSLY